MADLGDYKSCMIVHITDKGKVEFLKGKVSDSYITFDAAEFSAYGIVGFMGDSNEILSDQEKKKPLKSYDFSGLIEGANSIDATCLTWKKRV